jgi:hypothetical protein
MISLSKPAAGSTSWTNPVNQNWSDIEKDLNAAREMIRWAIQKDSGLATISNTGFSTAPSPEGTGSAINDATGQYINYSTDPTTKGAGWGAAAYTIVQTQNKPVFTMVVKTGANAADVQNCRIWCGLFTGEPMGSDTPAQHIAAFRYSTAVDGTAYWRCVTYGNSGSQTVTATTVAIAADTRYVLQVDCTDPASIKFYINGVLVATHTTSLPRTTQNMGFCAKLRAFGAAAKNIRICRVCMEHQ